MGVSSANPLNCLTLYPTHVFPSTSQGPSPHPPSRGFASCSFSGFPTGHALFLQRLQKHPHNWSFVPAWRHAFIRSILEKDFPLILSFLKNQFILIGG